MLWLSIIIAVLATLVGVGIASSLQQETGPIIVLVASGVFIISLLKRGPAGLRS
jgi:ABC-type Mn2+/Zn2+ transport system permease subunit